MNIKARESFWFGNQHLQERMYLNVMWKPPELFHLSFLQVELCGDFEGRYYAWKLNSTCFNEIAQSKHHNEWAVISNSGIWSLPNYSHINGTFLGKNVELEETPPLFAKKENVQLISVPWTCVEPIKGLTQKVSECISNGHTSGTMLFSTFSASNKQDHGSNLCQTCQQICPPHLYTSSITLSVGVQPGCHLNDNYVT